MTASVLFAAGGTGGHVYPALAVAQALRARCPQARIHFVGGRRGIERELVPAAGFPLTRFPAAGLRGGGALSVLRFCGAFALAWLGSLVLILRTRPDVVLATGGYASAAPAVAAATLRRPLWLQEQNAIPGATNRMLARFAQRAYVAFDDARAAFARVRHVEHVPNPVRAEILASSGQRPAPADFAAFGLSPGVPTLLVFGGSRGAHSLNQAVSAALPRLLQTTRWQLLVQTGAADAEAVRAVAERAALPASPPRVRVLPYIDQMARAYAIADLVVCRAGALTLAELAALGKPALLVPFPHAADDHQTRNAQAVAAVGAARIVADAQLNGTTLSAVLEELAAAPEMLAAMARSARALAGDADGASTLAAALAAACAAEAGQHAPGARS